MTWSFSVGEELWYWCRALGVGGAGEALTVLQEHWCSLARHNAFAVGLAMIREMMSSGFGGLFFCVTVLVRLWWFWVIIADLMQDILLLGLGRW
jgi:hypothetical protein